MHVLKTCSHLVFFQLVLHFGDTIDPIIFQPLTVEATFHNLLVTDQSYTSATGIDCSKSFTGVD